MLCLRQIFVENERYYNEWDLAHLDRFSDLPNLDRGLADEDIDIEYQVPAESEQ